MRLHRRIVQATLAGAGITLQDKPSIYPAPQQDILLLDTPSELEKQIAIARRYVTGTYTDAYAQVQSAVSKWIGVEHAVERRVKSFIAPEEPLTPGILYVGIAALTGSILTRSRALPSRLIVPPIFFLATLNHFLPKTSHNLGMYGAELEERYAPSLREKHLTANAHTRMTWERVKEATKDGREGLGRGVEEVVGKIQEATGLKIKETLGWGEVVVEKAEGKVREVVKVVEDNIVEAQSVAEKEVDRIEVAKEKEPKRLV